MFTTIYRSNLIKELYQGWIPEGSKVLDIACGDGFIAKELLFHFNCHLTGTDIYDYRKTNSFPFKKMKKDILPFNDNEFNIVMLNGALHHIKNWLPLFQEALRVGEVFLICDRRHSLIASIADIVANLIHYHKYAYPHNAHSLVYWIDTFKQMNLKFEYRLTRKAWWYPCEHIGFRIFKKKIK